MRNEHHWQKKFERLKTFASINVDILYCCIQFEDEPEVKEELDKVQALIQVLLAEIEDCEDCDILCHVEEYSDTDVTSDAIYNQIEDCDTDTFSLWDILNVSNPCDVPDISNPCDNSVDESNNACVSVQSSCIGSIVKNEPESNANTLPLDVTANVSHFVLSQAPKKLKQKRLIAISRKLYDQNPSQWEDEIRSLLERSDVVGSHESGAGTITIFDHNSDPSQNLPCDKIFVESVKGLFENVEEIEKCMEKAVSLGGVDDRDTDCEDSCMSHGVLGKGKLVELPVQRMKDIIILKGDWDPFAKQQKKKGRSSQAKQALKKTKSDCFIGGRIVSNPDICITKEDGVDNQSNLNRAATSDFSVVENKAVGVVDHNHFSIKEGVVCHECGRNYKNLKILRRHKKDVHKTKMYACESCQKKFKSKTAYEYHKLTHLNKKEFMCDLCGIGFYTNRKLKDHKEAVHLKTKQMTCDVCGKVYSNNYNLMRHKFIHTSPFHCDKCDRYFRHEKTFNNHIKSHSKFHSFRCRICDKGCSSESSLHNHERNEHKFSAPVERVTYVCDICGRKFKNTITVSRHMLSHSDEDLKSCLLCNDELFPSFDDLKSHILEVHLKNALMKCKDCGEGFYSAHLFNAHRSLHKDKNSVYCQICDKNFKTKYCLSTHQNAFHQGVTYSCTQCDRMFKTVWALRRHGSVHSGCKETFRCNVCKRSFSTRWNLKLHLYLHRGEKRFHCQFCQQGFLEKRSYKNHLLKQHQVDDILIIQDATQLPNYNINLPLNESIAPIPQTESNVYSPHTVITINVQ